MPKLNPSGKTMGQIAKEVASKSKAPVIKVNSNPNPTPAKGNKAASFASQEYAAEYYHEVVAPHYGHDTSTPVIKVNSNPVPTRTSGLSGVSGKLGGQHAGGHSDVSAAINLGGFTVKTPVIKPSSTKNK